MQDLTDTQVKLYLTITMSHVNGLGGGWSRRDKYSLVIVSQPLPGTDLLEINLNFKEDLQIE